MTFLTEGQVGRQPVAGVPIDPIQDVILEERWIETGTIATGQPAVPTLRPIALLLGASWRAARVRPGLKIAIGKEAIFFEIRVAGILPDHFFWLVRHQNAQL